tara:strand:+ start:16 stop:435 length:420 start_codon:yes stop_codon:yes gene_type:complete
MADKRKTRYSSNSSSSSSSNPYSSTDTRYRMKIAEYKTYKYNLENHYKEEQEYEIDQINKKIKSLRSKYSNISRIDAMRTTSNNITRRIKQSQDKRKEIKKVIETIPKKIKEADDCIKYYTNKLNKNKNSSTDCVYRKK